MVNNPQGRTLGDILDSLPFQDAVLPPLVATRLPDDGLPVLRLPIMVDRSGCAADSVGTDGANIVRTAPTAAELALLREQPPTAAFGFCIQTARPIRFVKGFKVPFLGEGSDPESDIPVLADAFKLVGGAAANGRWLGYGINVVATLEQMETIDRAMRGRDFPLTGYLLLRDGGNQVPVYDMNKRGATSLPMIIDRLTVA
jgi:hypothetical protein